MGFSPLLKSCSVNFFQTALPGSRLWWHSLFNLWVFMLGPPGGGGGYLTKLIRGGYAPRSNPLPFYIPFWQKRYPFYIPFIEKRHSFHIPNLEHCTPFLAPVHVVKQPISLPLLYTSTCEIPTLFVYLKPEKGTPFGRSLPVKAIIGSTPLSGLGRNNRVTDLPIHVCCKIHLPRNVQRRGSGCGHTPIDCSSYTHLLCDYTCRSTTRSCRFLHLQRTKLHRTHSSDPE